MQSDDRDLNQPTEHEQRVAEEMRDRAGQSEGPLGHEDVLTPADETDEGARSGGESGGGGQLGVAGQRPADRPTYGEEVEAEQAGTTAEELREDEDAPLDSAYKPRTG